jgi:CheY-like chemotaxis protein
MADKKFMFECPGRNSREATRILIADDNPVFRTVLQAMLTNWDYIVTVACDGKEAWNLLRADDSPRLAVLDWTMPGMDGLEVCRRIRSNLPTSYIYILILTARTRSEDLVEAMDAGADDYIQKPLKSQELRARLRAGSRIVELQQMLKGTGATLHGPNAAALPERQSVPICVPHVLSLGDPGLIPGPRGMVQGSEVARLSAGYRAAGVPPDLFANSGSVLE